MENKREYFASILDKEQMDIVKEVLEGCKEDADDTRKLVLLEVIKHFKTKGCCEVGRLPMAYLEGLLASYANEDSFGIVDL